jgi:hypothetical protein
MNRMGAGAGLNERGQSLVDAAYKALGYTSSKYGFWTRSRAEQRIPAQRHRLTARALGA